MMLKIEELQVSVNGINIINGVTLKANAGEVHVIMGPNGSGKSTLAKVLAGHPLYKVESGAASLLGIDLFSMNVEERARKGLFVSFQYPIEICGISNLEFLRSAYNSINDQKVGESAFRKIVIPIIHHMGMRESFLDRDLNDGFSGGEKKRNEIVQMMVLNPICCILDESDSGLDVDALKLVANGINRFMDNDKIIILITHYQRLLNYIEPTFVHIMIDGKIIKSGGPDLAREIEEGGYQRCS